MRVYKSVSPPPMADGPAGVVQYDHIVTAKTKAEAALVAGLRPESLEWEKDIAWHPLVALRDAGYLDEANRFFLTGAVRGADPYAIWQWTPDGWAFIGRVRYRDGDFSKPYLDPEPQD